MAKRWIVYIITNFMNKKVYIGQTSSSIRERMCQHFAFALRMRRTRLSNAIRKYGPDAFGVHVLHVVHSKEEADKFERREIASMKAKTHQYGYNMTDGGEGLIGVIRGVAWRNKMSIARKGKPRSPQAVAKTAAFLRGRPLSAEHRAAISKARKGMKFSAEHRMNLSLSHKDQTFGAIAKWAKPGERERASKIASDQRRREISKGDLHHPRTELGTYL